MAFRGLAVLVWVAAALSPAFAQDQRPAAPAPALWRVADADSEIYLFAAAPFLPEGEAWRSRPVAAAIDRADSIWFEAPSADPAAQAVAAKMFQALGRYGSGATLSAALGADGAASLAAAAQIVGAELGAIDQLKPWAAFVVLSAELDRKRGADPAAGVEAGVRNEAIGRQRPVQFLDTVEGALRVLTDMPAEDQRALLLHLLADWPQQAKRAPEIFALWRAGDAEGLARETQDGLESAAAGAYDRLVRARADALAGRIASLLEKPETAFLCLGAALVVGEEGVVAKLAAQGFSVERIDQGP